MYKPDGSIFSITPPKRKPNPKERVRLFWSVICIPPQTGGKCSKPLTYASLAAGDNDKHSDVVICLRRSPCSIIIPRMLSNGNRQNNRKNFIKLCKIDINRYLLISVRRSCVSDRGGIFISVVLFMALWARCNYRNNHKDCTKFHWKVSSIKNTILQPRFHGHNNRRPFS